VSAPPLGSDRLRQAAREAVGSAFATRPLAEDLPAEGTLARRLRGWTNEAMPLRLAAALHALGLSGEEPAGPAASVDRGGVRRLPWRFATPWLRRLHLALHAIAWTCVPPAKQAACAEAVQAAGARATRDAPLARLDPKGDGRSDGAALTSCHWPGGERLPSAALTPMAPG
jgi:hypothetical protein